VLSCDDAEILGCPFYVMERVHGPIIRRRIPEGVHLPPEQARRLAHEMIEALHELHVVDHRAIGLGDFGRPEGYVERQVEGWIERYREARTPDVPDGEGIMTWLRDHLPPDAGRAAVVHGDWKTDNLVLDRKDPTRITAVLDWEMATIGDPVMDLAYALIFFDEKRTPNPVGLSAALPPVFAQAVSREELLEHYQELAGESIDDIDFHYALNMFRLGGLLQQLYARYHRGRSRDERYAEFQVMVQALLSSAEQVTERRA
jgi:aminoglycoside phosphotransferase (APT) family kinase protein